MLRLASPLFLTILLSAIAALAQQKTVTIATVNNPDMVELKKLSPKFELDPVALAIVETDRLHVLEILERIGEASGRILAAGEEDEGFCHSGF